MNRKVLYRGMSTITRAWVYGYPELLSDKWVIVENDRSKVYVIIPETLGQFTGKQFGDIHIYEGDIDPKGNEIIWSVKSLGWFVKPASGGEEEPLYQAFFRPVGNIHEKPSFKSNIDIKLEKISDVIKRHLGANTPGWIIDNAIKAFEELNSMRLNNEI